MEKITQRDFAAHVGCDQSLVSKLTQRGIIDLDEGLEVSVRKYISRLREEAAGRASNGGPDLVAERARLAAAHAEKVEMQNAQKRRELAPLHLIELVIAQAGSRVAAILDAIPGALRRRNPALTAEDLEQVRDEIARARNIAAEMKLDDLITTD